MKSQILKRKGRKKRWLQGLPRFEPVQSVTEKKVHVKVRGKKRGRTPLSKLELSYPDNVVYLAEEFNAEDTERATPYPEKELEPQRELEPTEPEQTHDVEKKQLADPVCGISPDEKTQVVVPAVEGSPELDGSPLALLDCPVEQLHNYSLNSRPLDSGTPHPPDSSTPDEVNGIPENEALESVEDKVKRTWREKVLRTQQYAHMMYHCKFCRKDYKGLNVMRHALSHLKKKKLRCIICGKHFRQLPFAKKHVMDHIDEMYQRKPSKKPCIENTPAANGTLNVLETPPPAPKEETPPPVPPKIVPKTKLSALSREDRIIRNLRTLIKKTSVLHKKCKKPDSNIFKQLDFKDDQVVIKDGLVIIKEPTVLEDGGGEGAENPAGHNGFGVDITYHLCPSETCDRVFLKISNTLTKHAIRCHINEDKVLEKTFVWAKHKCTLCLRQIQFFQHYKDHMKLHLTHPQYFCYHQDCNERFAMLQELKDHVKTHEPFRPQCPFTACEKLFSSLQGLHDHEWRHYVPTPQKEELELGLNRQKKQNTEAPWKQRVKVEELWLQSKKGPRDSVNSEDNETACYDDLNIVIKTEDQIKTEDEEGDVNIANSSQGFVSTSDPSSEKAPSHEADKTNVNGYEDGVSEQALHPCIKQEPVISPVTAAKKLKRDKLRKGPTERDPLNIKDLDDTSTFAEGFQKKLEEPLIAEHKTFRPEDPSYATFVKAPFIRPPPSTYLDESVLSMRKRRATEEVAPKKNVYWVNKKKNDPETKEQKVAEVVPEQKIRHRCEKCLSSFSTADELKKHQALNTCSALFGFDSDDDN